MESFKNLLIYMGIGKICTYNTSIKKKKNLLIFRAEEQKEGRSSKEDQEEGS